MPDYSKGKIYTIRFHNDDENIYVGSTSQPLSVRFGNHKRKKNSQVYIYVFEKYNGNFSNCYIELYEQFPCENKEQLCKREGDIIRLIGTLNKEIAGRNQKQYRIDNAEKLKEYQKQYNIDNAEKLKEQQKQYYMDNLEKRKQQNKQYSINNADKLKEYKKQYYIDNAEIINEKKKERIRCECCNCDFLKRLISNHNKSKKHQKHLNKITPI